MSDKEDSALAISSFICTGEGRGRGKIREGGEGVRGGVAVRVLYYESIGES
jgi:hypothetical protein